MAIDVGAEAIDRTSSFSFGCTIIGIDNPANAGGTITSVEIWAANALEGCKVGIFYTTNGDTFKCRSVVSIGDVTGESKQTFSDLSLSIQAGDYIGMYYSVGAIERHTSGYSGAWYILGDHCIVDDEGTYTELAGDAISLKGLGTEGGAEYSESATVLVGVKPLVARTLAYTNLASVLVGVKPIAIASWIGEWVETALVYIGVKPIASRLLQLSRTATVLIGIKPIASRTLTYTNLASVLVGIKPIASRTLAYANSALVLVGVKATASVSWIGEWIETALVIVGIKPTASRVLSISRTATVQVGIVASASVVWVVERFIELTLNLYSRAATLSLYGRSTIINLYNRAISVLMRTKE